MSEEEKKAIEFIKFYQQHCLKKEKENMKQYETVNDEEFVSKNLDTVLNLITKLQKENEEKDKQIDLMVEKIYKRISAKELDKYCNKQKNNCKNYEDCFKCIKQYFETKAKKGE